MRKSFRSAVYIMLAAAPLACGPQNTALVADAPYAESNLQGSATAVSPAWGGAYPRLTRLADNSLLGSVTGFSNGVNHLRVTSSTDNGATFSDIGEIAQGVGDLDNIHTVQLDYTAPGASSPRILAAFRNHSRNGSGQYTTFRITVCRSDDGGKTWTFHSQVVTSQPPNGVWEPFLFKAPDTSLHVYYARENAADDQDVLMQRSTDGGLTWSDSQIVAGAGIISRDGMPGVATYFDGTNVALMAIFESESNGIFHVMSVKSTDDGASWSQRSIVFAPRAGHNAGSPQIVSVGGQLLAVFMTDEDAGTVNWPNNAAVKVETTTSISSSNVVWSAPYTIAQASAYWPGVLANGSQGAFVLYNSNVQSVSLANFAHSQTGKFKLVNPQSGLCLDISGGASANGTRVQIWTCNGLNPQRFTFVDEGEGLFSLHSSISDSCLDLSQISTQPGAGVQEWSCTHGKNQAFALKHNGDGSFALTFKHSGQCLDITGDGTKPGTPLEQWSCNGGPAQNWFVQADN